MKRTKREGMFNYYNVDGKVVASASIKGINGNDLYVYSDCYWFPIQDDETRKIKRR